jgi:hypothetical protein
MSWNYRVAQRDDELSIYSAYYDDNGRCHSISVEPARLYGDTVDDLRAELERFQAAIEKPVLRYEAFDKTPSKR